MRAALDLSRVLAHVRENSDEHPMRAAGWKHFASDRRESDAGDDRPTLSEVRFKRLLQTDDGEEKVTAFKRLITLLDGKVNVAAISRDFLTWNHPEYGDRIRENWAFYYYAAGVAAPRLPDDITLTSAEDDQE
jgi:CRISPR type I-E-associated protein CasB/Cse2